MKSQELANIIYSYSKIETAQEQSLLEDLVPSVTFFLEHGKFRPRELCQCLMAYVEHPDLLRADNDKMLKLFEREFKAKYEDMNPEDISKYYYCFTKMDRYGSGIFYRYLQKALTKTIKEFDSGNLRLMFIGFGDEQASRLNRGVRGRLQDRLYHLMDRK